MMSIARYLALAVLTAASDHHHPLRGNMCGRCKAGGIGDGVDGRYGCLAWCSNAGYCGDGDVYRRGLDCRGRLDVPTEARAAAESARAARYDAGFLAEHGKEGHTQHVRQQDHSERFGRAISIRGERHCGTGWVRIMTTQNCAQVRHFWSPKLDSDGLYGWKHDFIPSSLSSKSRDVMIVVFRNAASWVPKMLKASYSAPIEQLPRNLAAFLAKAFDEQGHSFTNLLDLRSQKYKQYLHAATTHDNVVAVRYEDLLVEPRYLFRHLSTELGLPCAHSQRAFSFVRGYAKFGGLAPHSTKGSPKAKEHLEKVGHEWLASNWHALVSRLDAGLELDLGYKYGQLGVWDAASQPAHSKVLRLENYTLERRKR